MEQFDRRNSEIRYLQELISRKCKPTPHAKQEDAYASGGGYCSYWLRTPGSPYFTSLITSSGQINENGTDSHYNDAVRPALWKRI